MLHFSHYPRDVAVLAPCAPDETGYRHTFSYRPAFRQMLSMSQFVCTPIDRLMFHRAGPSPSSIVVLNTTAATGVKFNIIKNLAKHVKKCCRPSVYLI